jgi:hypothetical protein
MERRAMRLMGPQASDAVVVVEPAGTAHNPSVLAVGWDRGADRASNDADVSSTPPIIPYGGFSPVRLEGWRIRRRLPEPRSA